MQQMHKNNPNGKTMYFSNAQITFPAASAILHKIPKSPIVAKAIKSIAIIVYLSAMMPNGMCTAGANLLTASRCGVF